MKLHILVSLLMLPILANAQKFKKLESSTDSTYGYTALKPLLLKKGDPVNSIRNTEKFFFGLYNSKGEFYDVLSRSSIFNPKYTQKEMEEVGMRNIKNGKPAGVMLDSYILVSESKSDTITLYVDIYNNGELKIPVGLKWK